MEQSAAIKGLNLMITIQNAASFKSEYLNMVEPLFEQRREISIRLIKGGGALTDDDRKVLALMFKSVTEQIIELLQLKTL